MRACADSVTVMNLPEGLGLYGAYVNGMYQNYAECKARFPSATVIGISVNSAPIGDCLDVEQYDAQPNQAVQWVQQRRAAGHGGPLVYCSESTWPEVAIQFDNARVAQPGYWIAGYPGSVGTGQLYVGAEGHQFIDHGSWDESVFVDFLPGIDPAPVPDLPPNVPVTTTYKENQMLARNTAGNGYWAVRPDGSTYAFDGAPYLGPAPHYRAEWGIGTAANPIVGIADDGHGGFVLEADTGAYPGSPALYRIDATGKYRD